LPESWLVAGESNGVLVGFWLVWPLGKIGLKKFFVNLGLSGLV
jgi:hypothetical protein